MRMAFLGLSVVLLHMGFSANAWRVTDEARFTTNQRDTESLVIGRLVKTRQDGPFSAGGLTGAGVPNRIHQGGWITADEASAQYAAYLDGSAFDHYSPYMSQTGGQGMVFGVLDSLLGLPPQETLPLLHTITSLLSALAFGLVALWFLSEFGVLAAAAVLSSLLMSEWLTLFGRNLWWSLWAFYVPMIGVMYYLKHSAAASRQAVRLGGLAFALVSIKCFVNGFEFITAAVVMMMVPLVYYGVVRQVTVVKLLRRSAALLAGAGLAIVASLTALSAQIARAVDGTGSEGWRHIWNSFVRRSYGAGNPAAELTTPQADSSVLQVIWTYLDGVYVDTSHVLSRLGFDGSSSLLGREVGYAHLIALFAVGSFGLLALRGSPSPEAAQRRNIALVITTWFSITAPLSWHVIFKGHSEVHTHINYLLWQMPFTLFGFAAVGLALRESWTAMVRHRAGRARRLVWVRRV